MLVKLIHDIESHTQNPLAPRVCSARTNTTMPMSQSTNAALLTASKSQWRHWKANANGTVEKKMSENAIYKKTDK